MHFTIITPSFNQLDYLRRCVASVADQAMEGIGRRALGVGTNDCGAFGQELIANRSISVHHHIQDACPSDGTREFLAAHLANSSKLTANGYSFSFASESDNGMYDAVNRGVELAIVGTRHQALGTREKPKTNSHKLTAERFDSIIAWLNCDEQYLPGTLQKVADFFGSHPEVDLVFGGMLMVDEQGELLACRKAMPMRRLFLEASYLYNYSCAMFFRASLWEKLGGFDTTFKNAGDEDLVRRALKLKANCYVLSDYLSIFTYAGSNLSSGGSAVEEHEALKRSSSLFARVFKLLLNLLRLAEKFIRRGHGQRVRTLFSSLGLGSDQVAFDVWVDHCGDVAAIRDRGRGVGVSGSCGPVGTSARRGSGRSVAAIHDRGSRMPAVRGRKAEVGGLRTDDGLSIWPWRSREDKGPQAYAS